MADAVAKAADLPAAAVRRAAMLGGDLPAVAAAALTAGEAALEQFTLKVGQPVGPMLAQTATGVADALERIGGTAVFEAKLDGARVQIHRAGDSVWIYTRSLDDVTARLPEVVDATLALPVTDLIADAEAIALRPDSRPHRFQVTASRFGRSVDIAAARTAQPLSVFVFDLLHLDGADLLDLPTSERIAALDAIVPKEHRVDRLDHRRRRGGTGFPRRHAGGRPRRRHGEIADDALRGRSPRRGLAEGQARAHARSGGARRRVGVGPPHRQAVEHPPRRQGSRRPANSSCSERLSKA